MNLSHFTRKPITALRDTPQKESEYLSPYDKPRGFWVSVDGEDDWESWCRSEEFGDIDKCIRYKVALSTDANILHISKDMTLPAFEREYGRPDSYEHSVNINWSRVASAYDGIIIAPYHWPFRLEHDWYYPWDCASGCIWKASAIQSLEESK